MGGYNSGAERTANNGAMEDHICLRMSKLRRAAYLRAGNLTTGSWGWSRGVHDQSIGLAVDLRDPSAPTATLSFSVAGESREQRIAMVAEPCRFGGLRYFFLCPATARRCLALTCVGGWFASRQAHRLTYKSQTEGYLDRLTRNRALAEDRALGQSGHPKPRGANRERLLERWFDLESEVDRIIDGASAVFR